MLPLQTILNILHHRLEKYLFDGIKCSELPDYIKDGKSRNILKHTKIFNRY